MSKIMYQNVEYGESGVTSVNGNTGVVNIKTINGQGLIGSGNLTINTGLLNLVDGSATGSMRGIGTDAESSSYTMGDYAVAEGYKSRARGSYAHAEGWLSMATGIASHAEGNGSLAIALGSHAEGASRAYGEWSHAQNISTFAHGRAQTVLGEWNEEESVTEEGVRGTYAVIIGNGTNTNTRSNALTIDWNGNTEQQGHATTKDMTSSEVTSFVNGLNMVASKAADYVVEQGTNGIWTYRKWQSGIAECWGTYTASIAITTASAAYGGYRSGTLNIPAFPITFVSTPSVTGTSNNTMGYWVNNLTPTTTGGTFYLSMGTSSDAANRTIAFHVIGKWK